MALPSPASLIPVSLGMSGSFYLIAISLVDLVFLGYAIALCRSNYAALACLDFSTCQGRWQPEMDFTHDFSLHREQGETADDQLLPHAALTAIH